MLPPYFYNYIKNATPRNFASEITQKLHEDGNKIIIVTARYKTKEDSIIGQQMREDTRNWLIKNNIYFDEIYFTISPKVSAIQENNIDVMIDDSPEVLPEIVKVTKVFCYDNRYNRDIMLPNMTKVYSWYDIYRKIKEIG